MVNQQVTPAALLDALTYDLALPMREGGVRAFAAERLLTRVLRKLEPTDTADTSRSDVALSTFLRMNEKSSEWRWYQQTESDAQFDDDMRLMFWRMLSGYTLASNYTADWGLGPGASRGCKTNDPYTKLFDSCLTTTSAGLYNRYVHSLLLSQVVETPKGPRNSALDAEKRRRKLHGAYKIVEGASLSFVRKDSKTDRCIFTEPLLNMMAQKAVGKFLERCLGEYYDISLTAQPQINAAAARVGSVTKKLATVDLRSASDCISLGLLKMLFPASFVRVLLDCRSPFVKLPNGSLVEVQMVSGMGNGFTFPLQTVLFASVVAQIYRRRGLDDTVNVFGDDMIVRDDCYDELCHHLERYGFIVNTDKSYRGDDPFRESCGGDYYEGVAVKPVYVRRLENRRDLISAFNRLRLWGEFHYVFLRRTLQLLRRGIGRCSLYQPFTGDVGDAIMCTRRQASIRYPDKRSESTTSNGHAQYHRVSRMSVVLDPEQLQNNSLGALLVASSGQAQSAGRDCLLALKAKQPALRQKRLILFTSMWQDQASVACALYKTLPLFRKVVVKDLDLNSNI